VFRIEVDDTGDLPYPVGELAKLIEACARWGEDESQM
jgi:hypothetical protein